ncbi:MAG: ABC transporter substrate-binding protein [Nannocystaceae bacterium]|nr:ABC transporter substrate-binding protein [bacterium]
MLRNAVLAGAAAWMLGSCSLVLEFDECRSNDDCSNSSGDTLVCNLETATCESRPEPDEVVCESIDTCTELYGEDSTCGTSGRCALLTSDECTEVLRPAGASADDIVWIGSILATSEPFTSAVQPIENAVELAIDDFNSATTLADGRKVGWIACDSGGSTSAAVAAAEHLIEDVGVSAIIGPTTSEEVLEISALAAESGTFFISPSATAASISSLDDSGLVWRTISSDIVQSNAIADRLASMDPPPTSILVLAKNDEYGVGLFEPMVQRLAQQLPGVPTGSLLYPDPVGLSSDELQRAYATVIAEGFAQEADVIVFLGSSEVLEVLRAYLLAWNNTGMLLPRFLVSHGAVPSLLLAPSLVADSFAPTLIDELEGVSPVVQEPDNFEAFNIRYRVVYSDANTLSSSPLGYDAAAVALLGLVAGGPDGVAIASAMPRLADPSGTAVPLGDVAGLVAARDLLVAGENIDISGVSGPLDFDLVAGEVTSNYVGWDVTPVVTEEGTQGQLVSARAYVLEDGVQGTWTEL